MTDTQREAFEKIMRESGIDVGPFMPNVGAGCYAWSQTQLDWGRMKAMWQAAISSCKERDRLHALLVQAESALLTVDEAMRNGSAGLDANKEKIRALNSSHKKAVKTLTAIREAGIGGGK